MLAVLKISPINILHLVVYMLNVLSYLSSSQYSHVAQPKSSHVSGIPQNR